MKTNNATLKITEDGVGIKQAPIESRERLLAKLDEVIDFLHKKAIQGRIKNPENEKVRIQWFKALTYACSIYNQIKRDVELDEVKEDMEEIKQILKNRGD